MTRHDNITKTEIIPENTIHDSTYSKIPRKSCITGYCQKVSQQPTIYNAYTYTIKITLINQNLLTIIIPLITIIGRFVRCCNESCHKRRWVDHKNKRFHLQTWILKFAEKPGFYGPESYGGFPTVPLTPPYDILPHLSFYSVESPYQRR